MGQRASDTRGITFEDVEVPDENVLGTPGSMHLCLCDGASLCAGIGVCSHLPVCVPGPAVCSV